MEGVSISKVCEMAVEWAWEACRYGRRGWVAT